MITPIATVQVATVESDLLSSVPDILEYGAFGLAFLMAFLGYLLIRKCVATTSEDPSKLEVAKFYLKISLVFMLVAAATPLAEVLLKPSAKVLVQIEPWDEEILGDDVSNYGDFYISVRGSKSTYSGDTIEAEVADDTTIECHIYPYTKKLRELQSQVVSCLQDASADQQDAGI